MLKKVFTKAAAVAAAGIMALSPAAAVMADTGTDEGTYEGYSIYTYVDGEYTNEEVTEQELVMYYDGALDGPMTESEIAALCDPVECRYIAYLEKCTFNPDGTVAEIDEDAWGDMQMLFDDGVYLTMDVTNADGTDCWDTVEENGIVSWMGWAMAIDLAFTQPGEYTVTASLKDQESREVILQKEWDVTVSLGFVSYDINYGSYPSSVDATAGSTETLGVETVVKNASESETYTTKEELDEAGLAITWLIYEWEGSNTDAVIAENGGFTADITFPSKGDYYVEARLTDSDGNTRAGACYHVTAEAAAEDVGLYSYSSLELSTVIYNGGSDTVYAAHVTGMTDTDAEYAGYSMVWTVTDADGGDCAGKAEVIENTVDEWNTGRIMYYEAGTYLVTAGLVDASGETVATLTYTVTAKEKKSYYLALEASPAEAYPGDTVTVTAHVYRDSGMTEEYTEEELEEDGVYVTWCMQGAFAWYLDGVAVGEVYENGNADGEFTGDGIYSSCETYEESGGTNFTVWPLDEDGLIVSGGLSIDIIVPSAGSYHVYAELAGTAVTTYYDNSVTDSGDVPDGLGTWSVRNPAVYANVDIITLTLPETGTTDEETGDEEDTEGSTLDSTVESTEESTDESTAESTVEETGSVQTGDSSNLAGWVLFTCFVAAVMIAVMVRKNPGKSGEGKEEGK